ncbi:MAG: DUF1835 domain-containing protein [Ginsengibacter sp.]
MIHVVFQQADVEALKKSFDLDESLRGDVEEIKDDYAVGPLENIYTEEGIEHRKNWWREVLKGGDYEGKVDAGEVDDQKAFSRISEKLDTYPGETLWIWIAPNTHDVSGYYWLISQLKIYQDRVSVLHLHNLPFINDKGHIFYPNNLFEIPAKEFVKAKKLERTITTSEFEIDPDEWTKICSENKGVRILEGGKKLSQHDYDYYDSELLKYITPDWQKASKAISHFLHKAKQTTGDAYLLWRIKQMIADGKIDAQGELKNMKDFEVKLKVNTTD